MTDCKSYTAVCRRVGSWWAIDVPEINGVHTQARRLDQAETMARDAIALMLDVPEDSFDVELQPILSAPVEADIAHARELRLALEALQREAALAAEQVARELVRQVRLTVRDAGSLLGVSYQRVGQLLQSGGGAPVKRPTKRRLATTRSSTIRRRVASTGGTQPRRSATKSTQTTKPPRSRVKST